jgi:hypothetical protein
MASDKNFSGPENSGAFITELCYLMVRFPTFFVCSFNHKTILHIILKKLFSESLMSVWAVGHIAVFHIRTKLNSTDQDSRTGPCLFRTLASKLSPLMRTNQTKTG